MPPARRRRTTQGAGSNDKISEPDDHAIGRSRGGLTTKVHALVTSGVRPVTMLLSAGQAGDNPRLVPLLKALATTGHRPDRLLADKAYSHPSTRRELRRRRLRHTIPERSDQAKRRKDKGPAGGRPPGFDPELYKQRNTVERAIGRLKEFRAVAMRTDKREFVFRGTIDVASIKIWLRHPTGQDPKDRPWFTRSNRRKVQLNHTQ